MQHTSPVRDRGDPPVTGGIPLPQLVHAETMESSIEPYLEGGDIVMLPPDAVALPVAADLDFLRDELPEALAFKNISYHPTGGFLSGVKGSSELRQRTRRILVEHHERVANALSQWVPSYAPSWSPGKVNFRPLQEQGRDLPRRSSNEYLHVDAFACGATHGDRVLRVFTNLHVSEPRVWRTAGTFADLWPRSRERLGANGGVLAPGIADRCATAALRALQKLGVPHARMLESSPYDRLMRRVHNDLKFDDALHSDARQARFELPPSRTWAVMTDGVSHAVVHGQYALADTFHIPLSCCHRPQLAPYHVMQKSTP